jgi:hypothetical protein
MTSHRRAGRRRRTFGGRTLAAEVTLDTFPHVSRQVFHSKISVLIEQMLAAESIAFSSNPFHSSGNHLVIERVHFALIIQIDVIDGEPLCAGHVVPIANFYSIGFPREEAALYHRVDAASQVSF